MDKMDNHKLNEALQLLESRIRREGGGPVNLVVCGGSALIATNLIQRTTKDVNFIALKPTENEVFEAAQWSRTHDVSAGYAMLLKELLSELGYVDAASRIQR